ncbi:MAG: hypothetical protein B7Z10_08585 [Rhodobacterales bacterium 32-66-7]|nr:MAG: hypothetical protein B7Z10_08585 [Rhodobacterales bacterium 32-66-7]
MLCAFRLVLVWGLTAGAAPAACRIALVLALDVSASVDDEEYRLQAEGTAAALLSPKVSQAILDGNPVALAAFTWSGQDEHALVADWVVIQTQASLEVLAAQLAAFPRPMDGRRRTATGSALLFARVLLDRAPACDRQVIDLATDGAKGEKLLHGPDAFVEQAEGYTDFARTMTRKLERELQGVLMGALQ